MSKLYAEVLFDIYTKHSDWDKQDILEDVKLSEEGLMRLTAAFKAVPNDEMQSTFIEFKNMLDNKNVPYDISTFNF
jgi:hypothetical protein